MHYYANMRDAHILIYIKNKLGVLIGYDITINLE